MGDVQQNLVGRTSVVSQMGECSNFASESNSTVFFNPNRGPSRFATRNHQRMIAERHANLLDSNFIAESINVRENDAREL